MLKYYCKFGGYFLLAFYILGCQEADPIPLSLEASLRGRITLTHQYSVKLEDSGFSDVRILLVRESEEYKFQPDPVTGEFEILGLEMGTYDVSVQKEGYSHYPIKGVQLVGGQESNYLRLDLMKNPETKIQLKSIERIGNDLVINGHSDQVLKKEFVSVRFFIGNDEQVSDTNYSYTVLLSQVEDNGDFVMRMSYEDGLYIVAMAQPSTLRTFYDIELDRYIFLPLGERSNVIKLD